MSNCPSKKLILVSSLVPNRTVDRCIIRDVGTHVLKTYSHCRNRYSKQAIYSVEYFS